MAFSLEYMTGNDHKRLYSDENKYLIGKYCGVLDTWDPISKERWAIDPERGAVFQRLAAWAPP